MSQTSQSFNAWSDHQPLGELLSRAEAGVRARPQDAPSRWLLFELLCVLGNWERALKQLQAWGQLSRTRDGTAQLMRSLIRAELQRMKVLGGRAEPATISASNSEAAAWTGGLADALRLAAQGEQHLRESDAAREAALDSAPDTPGRSNLVPSFVWITDSDTRLGPVCEVVLMGAYRWLAFDDMRALSKAAPARLLDLVWSPVELTLRDGALLKGYMPMRYPIEPADRDAVLLARETTWTEIGRTGVHAHGQKMWATSDGDMPLLDLRDCRFGTAACDEGEQHAAQ